MSQQLRSAGFAGSPLAIPAPDSTRFATANGKARAVSMGEDFFIYQPARSVWGCGPGPVSEIGATWPEVSCAHGVEHGNGPVEDPVRIH